MNNNSCWALQWVCGLQSRTKCCCILLLLFPRWERVVPSLVAVNPGFFIFILWQTKKHYWPWQTLAAVLLTFFFPFFFVICFLLVVLWSKRTSDVALSFLLSFHRLPSCSSIPFLSALLLSPRIIVWFFYFPLPLSGEPFAIQNPASSIHTYPSTSPSSPEPKSRQQPQHHPIYAHHHKNV